MSAPSSRLSQLDALRGLAAMSVLLFHYTSEYPRLFSAFTDKLWFRFSSGSIGVELFFAISGFVIFLTLERVSTIRQFAVSRLARLYPPYIVCCLITTLVIFGLGFNHRHQGLDTVLMAPLFVNGLLFRHFIDPSYWTLTLEVCFYAYIGLAYFKLGRTVALRSLLVWLALSVAARLTGVVDDYPRVATLFNLQYSHYFAAGIAVYLLYARRDMGFALGLLAMAIVAASLAAGDQHSTEVFNLKNLIKAAMLSTMVYLAACGYLVPLAFRPLVLLGEISYSLYLIHQVLGFYVIHALQGAVLTVNANVAVLAAIAISTLLAYVVRRYVEVPGQRWVSKRLSAS